MPLTPDQTRLKNFLDEKVAEYNQAGFIENDPISIPHLFSRKQDIEIAALFAAIFAWGNRRTIINKTSTLLHLMDDAPYDFCVHHSEKDLIPLMNFVHRTFNGDDLLYFISFLKHHYQREESLESAFFGKESESNDAPVTTGLNHFYDYFFSLPYLQKRTRKHVAAPKKKSACKRLNMFLRWMVRSDDHGVDFGIWKRISPSHLVCPLDVHVSKVARILLLLERKQNDWAAAVELTNNLALFDAGDPVKYDFALFGLGVEGKF